MSIVEAGTPPWSALPGFGFSSLYGTRMRARASAVASPTTPSRAQVGGLATVEWLTPDVEDAAETHFAVGSAIMACLTAAALLSRRIRRDRRARTIHPLLGATALLLCGLQIFLGLQLLP